MLVDELGVATGRRENASGGVDYTLAKAITVRKQPTVGDGDELVLLLAQGLDELLLASIVRRCTRRREMTHSTMPPTGALRTVTLAP